MVTPGVGLPPLPGAVGVSRLRVYPWPTPDGLPDGLRGGSPHLHLACSEAYVVVGGQGAVQTLTLADGFRQRPLAEGDLVWFTPGTIHRLVNDDALDIVVIMQNSGLPEAGDAVLTLPPEFVADPAAYAAATRLPVDPDPDPTPSASAEATPEHPARRRRDLAVEGFLRLRAAYEAGDDEPLREFHRHAAALVSDLIPGWRDRWAVGAAAAAHGTGAVLEALAQGSVEHLRAASVSAAAAQPRLGMCGWLRAF